MNYDYWYNKWIKSNLSTACVLRVTNKCNQKCEHCAFRSSPTHISQMSIKMCEKINDWVPKTVVLNIMGGEFSVLDNYPEILVALAHNRNQIRLVTNGFWSTNREKSAKFLNTIKRLIDICRITVAVSTDNWHESLGYRKAIELLENFDLDFDFIDAGELKTNDIRPIGRAWDNKIVPNSSIHCACEQMSNMIITEDGMVDRCPFGYFPWKHFSETTWYDAQEYVWGWRSEKLAEGMNCHACMEVEATQCGVAK